VVGAGAVEVVMDEGERTEGKQSVTSERWRLLLMHSPPPAWCQERFLVVAKVGR
jgi:hypothetical protein